MNQHEHHHPLPEFINSAGLQPQPSGPSWTYEILWSSYTSNATRQSNTFIRFSQMPKSGPPSPRLPSLTVESPSELDSSYKIALFSREGQKPTPVHTRLLGRGYPLASGLTCSPINFPAPFIKNNDSWPIRQEHSYISTHYFYREW